MKALYRCARSRARHPERYAAKDLGKQETRDLVPRSFGVPQDDARRGITHAHLARFVVSICCCAVLLTGGCSDAPLDFPRTASFAFNSPQETKLGRAIEPQAKAHPGESGVYLLAGGGPDALVARTVLIDAAEKSIDFQYFMFEDDLVSNFLLDHLFAAADRGVHVRMLLDDYWQAGRDRRLAGIGAHPNIELRVFNPVGGDRVHSFSRSLNYVFGPERIRGRMHNKSLIVDAAAVIVGGRNIADEYFAANSEYNFGDVDMVVIGHAVTEVAQTFDQYWNAPLALPIQAFVPAKQGPACLAEVNARLEKSRPEARHPSTHRRCASLICSRRCRRKRCRLSGVRMKHWPMHPANHF